MSDWLCIYCLRFHRGTAEIYTCRERFRLELEKATQADIDRWIETAMATAIPPKKEQETI